MATIKENMSAAGTMPEAVTDEKIAAIIDRREEEAAN
jgi:hypothetical protein